MKLDQETEQQEDQESDSGHVEFDGVVESTCRGNQVVLLETGTSVKTYITGRMKKFKISVMPGDKVRVKLSPYDLTSGIISYRYKD